MVIQWLMFQMGGIGPMLGQANHFRGQAPDNEYGVRRYTNEASRLYGVVEKRLADHEYLADEYSIADIACYPWLQGHEKQGQDLNELPERQTLVRSRHRPAGRATRPPGHGRRALDPHGRQGAGNHVRGEAVRAAVASSLSDASTSLESRTDPLAKALLMV